MKSWHLHIKGQVQGVGFRPFVYQLARQFQLSGWVNNTADGVHVVFNAGHDRAKSFSEAVYARAPRLSRISSYQLRETAPRDFTDFRIVHSQSAGTVNLMLTPDFAMCADCRAELLSTGDRRKAYPFISCTHCGPRFSIIHKLPYDRETTTMASFRMCPDCHKEYHDPLDRRYYSQTNSCPECAIELSLIDRHGEVLSKDPDAIIRQSVQQLQTGHILAVKGIGGYLLCCDAGNPEAIRELRARKHRPSKPFALMYPSLEAVDRELELPPPAREEIHTYRSPIVLLYPGAENSLEQSLPDIAPGLSKIGVMLPYAPIYELILRTFGRPIVATSANISNAPIVFEDEKAKRDLLQIADYLLMNDRRIVIPQDDSVVQYSPFFQERIILRRSRGMAPNYFGMVPDIHPGNKLATGAMLKSTFALTHQGNTFISQYLGDLQDFATEESFQHTLEHFLQLFDTRPEMILVDKHPDYASTRLGKSLAERFGVPLERIQHHIAHFCALLGEHRLTEHRAPILGVIWDGTGLGDDGQIWGGECFIYREKQFSRWGHFEYFDFLLGDKMPREPRISALSLCWNVEGAATFIRSKFSDTEWSIYRKMLSAQTSLQTSSVGRLFDAVASLLGLGDHQTYEGEAATKLEQLAISYFKKHGLAFSACYCPSLQHSPFIPTKALITGIIQDMQAGVPAAYIAAKFHFSLVIVIKLIAEQLQLRHIACSGGVFQNGLLIDLLREHLGNDYQLYFHRELSPNDESVSFGQLIAFQIQQRNSCQNVLSDSR